LIDGFDEVSSDLARNEMMARIITLAQSFPKITVIVTTRPYASIERVRGIETFVRYRISPISFKDASKILTKIRGKGEGGDSSLELLRKLDSQHGIDLNPLFVTVFGLLAQIEKKDLPANITELFSKFTELMLGRWDTNKGLDQQYQSNLKRDLVSRFALSLHRARRTRFTRPEFEAFVAIRLEEINLTSDLSVVTEEILARSGLFRGEPTGLEFRHHLIQEFFAGSAIPDTGFVQSVLTDDWWRTPVVFYFGRNPDAINSLRKLAASIEDVDLESCVTIGLSLQALYLSPIRDRIEVWKWVVDSAAKVTQELNTGDTTPYPLIEFVVHYLITRDAVALNGIEKETYGALAWATSKSSDEAFGDLRRFWAATGLIEIGQVGCVKDMLESKPISDEKLNTALYVGCQMVATVRAVPDAVRETAREICLALEDKTLKTRTALMHEFKGRLLELRQGKIVALDDEYETPQ
jgi:hypothetical protein